MADRGSFGPTVLAGLAGAGLAALAGTKGWVHVGGRALSPTQLPTAAEAAKVPLAGALALVLLATWGVILVTRGGVRRLVAVFGVLIGVALVVTIAVQAPGLSEAVRRAYATGAATQPTSISLGAWVWVALAGTVISLAALLVAIRRAPRWPEMGRKYDTPGGAATAPTDPDELALWKALDEGHDPTA